jgi:hypothetical protein
MPQRALCEGGLDKEQLQMLKAQVLAALSESSLLICSPTGRAPTACPALSPKHEKDPEITMTFTPLLVNSYHYQHIARCMAILRLLKDPASPAGPRQAARNPRRHRPCRHRRRRLCCLAPPCGDRPPRLSRLQRRRGLNFGEVPASVAQRPYSDTARDRRGLRSW